MISLKVCINNICIHHYINWRQLILYHWLMTTLLTDDYWRSQIDRSLLTLYYLLIIRANMGILVPQTLYLWSLLRQQNVLNPCWFIQLNKKAIICPYLPFGYPIWNLCFPKHCDTVCLDVFSQFLIIAPFHGVRKSFPGPSRRTIMFKRVSLTPL